MILSIVGKSKRGKTTLLNHLITVLKTKGYTVCVIKHSDQLLTYQDFDHKGKDTYTFSQAGADEVWLTSPHTTYHIQSRETPLDQIVNNTDADFIFTEGFKKAETKKIVLKEPGDSIDVKGEILITIEGKYDPEKIVELLIQ
jgi:molybdopterin-guanine dinucleotide biosynthesis protein MobB